MGTLTVRLLEDYASSGRTIAQIREITITGAEMELPGYPIAAYRDGRWRLPDEQFLSLETDVPASIEFKSESSSVVCGPFDSVRIIGGLIHVSQPDWQPFARLEFRSGLWHTYADRTAWPQIVITAAASGS